MVLNVAAAAPPPANRPSLAVEQAVAALRAGDSADAERTLRAHLLTQPDDPQALLKLAEIAGDQGRARETVLLLSRAVKAAPGLHDARLKLARLLHDQGEPHLALQQIERLPGEVRAIFDVQTLEAALLGILGRHEPEIAIYEQLVARHPDHCALWMSLGNALKYAGRAQDSVRARIVIG